MLKQADYDRYITALTAPEPARGRLLALYAFHSELAKLPMNVSDPAIGFIRLAWWREVLAEIREGKPARPHEVAQAITKEGLPLDDLEELITGYEADIEQPQAEDLSELKTRIHNTTGRLNRIALEILGASDADTRKASDALSLAWGLLGVIRAEREGRNALPPDATLREVETAIAAALKEVKTIQKSPEAKPLFLLVPIAAYHLRHRHRGFGYYMALLRGMLFQ